jgi:ferrous iron transport protein B
MSDVVAEKAGTPPAKEAGEVYVALTGNPNSGKTTLFNALTGLRAKVGNYAGVTVERKEGRLKGAPAGAPVVLLDLPGTYSLSPKSLDEQISRDVLFHALADVPPPGVVVVVVDASNLERNLYYATQVVELGYPTIIALNMMDVARDNGHEVDAAALAAELGVPVMPIIASRGEGVPALRDAIAQTARGAKTASTPLRCALPPVLQKEVEGISTMLAPLRRPVSPNAEGLLLLSDANLFTSHPGGYPAEIQTAVDVARKRIESAGLDWRSAAIEARYALVGGLHRKVVVEGDPLHETLSDRLDRVLTHKVWGMLIFVVLMGLIFQCIFTFAELPMRLLEQGVDWFGGLVGRVIPEGALNSLLVNGVIAGVGAVIVFLPQILMLFFFIGLLEDTGYMARAAFLMDRLMSRVGLHGKSFIPMLSSFACAIPGIMATRTIEAPRDRLVTILVAPLMSCSARLPVYTVLIAACIPDVRVLGVFKLSGLTMLAMYLLGITLALIMAWIFKRTLLKGETPMMIMELPPYKRPVVKVTLRHIWDRSQLFLRRAGTTILGIMILLWFLASYPKDASRQGEFDAKRKAAATMVFPALTDPAEIEKARAGYASQLEREEAGANLRNSFAGRLGRLIEPLIAPLGFDWKIGIGIIGSFAAREVFVSTMSTVYNVGESGESDEGIKTLAVTLREQRRPNGAALYTPLLGITLMVFYVFALQCVSTVAVVRRETNSWKWPLFQWAYMGALAWILAFVTWHAGRLLGWS